MLSLERVREPATRIAEKHSVLSELESIKVGCSGRNQWISEFGQHIASVPQWKLENTIAQSFEKRVKSAYILVWRLYCAL